MTQPYVERERKFLVSDRSAVSGDVPTRIQQGYLVVSAKVELRVRLIGAAAILTLKSGEKFITRDEYEVEIPFALGKALYDECEWVIEKDRYTLIIADHGWDVDVFYGRNSGLVMAEVELPTPDSTIRLPSWCSTEVTGDERYYNSYLAQHPYSEWIA